MTTNTTNNGNVHYFASTAFNWAKAPTRAEAIAKVARDIGATTIKQQVKHNGGVYVWSCQVLEAQDHPYAIDFFKPEGVEIRKGQDGLIINTKGHMVAQD